MDNTNVSNIKRSSSYSLLSGAQEYQMMLQILHSNALTQNCWSQISKLLGISSPSIIKNTFYSRANAYYKKIHSKKYINLTNEEEIAKVTFYVMIALDYLSSSFDTLGGKPNYVKTMITNNNLTPTSLNEFCEKYGLILDKESLILKLNKIVCKYESISVVHPVCIPKFLELPINKSKQLVNSLKRMKFSEALESETKNSLLFFFQFPRKYDVQCSFKKPNILMN